METLAVDDAADGDEKKKKKKKNKSKFGKGPSKEQTNPPTIPIAELYPDGEWSLKLIPTYLIKNLQNVKQCPTYYMDRLTVPFSCGRFYRVSYKKV